MEKKNLGLLIGGMVFFIKKKFHKKKHLNKIVCWQNPINDTVVEMNKNHVQELKESKRR